METAEQTVLELANVPQCQEEVLIHLSATYHDLIFKIKEDLKSNSSILRPYFPYNQGNYLLKKELQLAQISNALEEMEQNVSDIEPQK